METLPFFLHLLKKNFILYSIISTGSCAQVDWKKNEHLVWGDNAIEFKNFRLSEHEQFPSILVMFTEMGIHINFQTTDPKYFTNTKFYFNADTTIKLHNPYKMDGTPVDHNSKNLGEFKEFNPSVRISLHKSSVYGYSINVNVDNKVGMEMMLKKSFDEKN